MKRIIWLVPLLLVTLASPAVADLKVFSTVPEWAALATEIGGRRIDVASATTALQDAHHVDARPSLIARARQADLVLATGAELEVGWLPVVLRESGNPRIQVGQLGYFEAAAYVTLREAPSRIDRADGDVHAAGNPHIQTDARHFLRIGEAMSERFSQLDPVNAVHYRASYVSFAERWRRHLVRWETLARPLKGIPVVTQHKAWTYLFEWLGLREVGTLEPKPGAEPTVAHLSKLKAQTVDSRPRMVIRAPYNAERPAEWFSAQTNTSIVVLPFTVGGTPEARDCTSLFDDTLNRLLKAM